MKRLTILLTAAAALFYLSALPLFAQHGPGGGHGGGAGVGAGHGAAGTRSNPNTSGDGKATHTQSMEQLNDVISNPSSKLAMRLKNLLPSGMTLASASTGFKSLGQFVAALHVYKNLGLASKTPPVSWTDFATLAQTKSLGAAIKHFDPTANASSESKKGKKQANGDLKESS
jgi:hypothetical protein